MSHCAYKYTPHTHTHTQAHMEAALSIFGGMCCDPCRRSDAATHPEVAIRMRLQHKSVMAIFLMKSMQHPPPPGQLACPLLYAFSPCLPVSLLVSSAYAQINLIANKLPGASKRKQQKKEQRKGIRQRGTVRLRVGFSAP